MPMMYMLSGHEHSSPHTGCSEVGDGDYQCTVYYLMPSEMMGTPMGTTVVVDRFGVVQMNEDYKDGTRLNQILGQLP